ncbi:MAG: hypothetical protein AAFP19_26510 [Bacteroidota bacterium]
MDNTELQNIWKAYDQKLDQLLAVNQVYALDLTRQKLHRQISRLYRPKWTAIIIGLPYALFLVIVTTIAFLAQAYFVAIGFGAIALITIFLLMNYFYHLHLINQVRNNEEVLSTQQQLSKLRLSSFHSLNMAVFQLPFWSICWISTEALKESPLLYGGINLIVFLLLSFIAYWLYQQLNTTNKPSKVRDFLLSGDEWEPILKAEEILEQLRAYERGG